MMPKYRKEGINIMIHCFLRFEENKTIENYYKSEKASTSKISIYKATFEVSSIALVSA